MHLVYFAHHKSQGACCLLPRAAPLDPNMNVPRAVLVRDEGVWPFDPVFVNELNGSCKDLFELMLGEEIQVKELFDEESENGPAPSTPSVLVSSMSKAELALLGKVDRLETNTKLIIEELVDLNPNDKEAFTEKIVTAHIDKLLRLKEEASSTPFRQHPETEPSIAHGVHEREKSA